jgi:hypothetical protein
MPPRPDSGLPDPVRLPGRARLSALTDMDRTATTLRDLTIVDATA